MPPRTYKEYKENEIEINQNGNFNIFFLPQMEHLSLISQLYMHL